MKKIAVFGATGSIGIRTADVAERHSDKLRASVLTCGRNVPLLREQIARLKPSLAVVCSGASAEADAAALSRDFPQTEFLTGEAGLSTAAEKGDYDVMLNAITGIGGLVPTWKAIESGRDVALANKESVVAGGAAVMAGAARRGVSILPVDSEHSAIFQAAQGRGPNLLKRILLTASGGPFRGFTREQLKTVTPKQALSHPNWEMGRKITVDSATMMNKGLELIEASWLFDMPPDRIDVVIHPQSVIHSMVEFEDNAVIAQMGTPDMRACISYALSYPERWAGGIDPLDFFKLGRLDFEAPDTEVFTCLRLARQAAEAGGSYPAALNAADERLVGLFLEGKIEFIEIQENIERLLDRHVPLPVNSLEAILEADKAARRELDEQLKLNR
jgi:1-deoxy-D-xylulose-5-phosphate reductoisomerase